MRIAAIGDLHCRANGGDEMRGMLEGVDRAADVLVLAGDLTHKGRPEELEPLLVELRRLGLQIVAVMGNHDHESDRADELVSMLRAEGAHVLEGGVCEIDGVGFVGTKGFCGGFGKLAVQPIGERALKTFLGESIEEARILGGLSALLNTKRKVAVLHYAPIEETVEGEPRELYPFLGTSLLAEALDRSGVDVIVHGHVHKGSPEGRTPGGIPVHNVCRFVRKNRGLSPYLILEI